MADVVEITLGERKYGIRRLTIGQLLDVDAIQMVGNTIGKDQDPDEPADVFMRRLGARMLDTIVAALARDFPEMTRQAISEIEMGADDLRLAYTTVLRHAGLIAGEVAGNP